MLLSRKPKTEKTISGPPTRAEFSALSKEFAAFKMVVGIAIGATYEAAKSPPGTPAADARSRFEKLAAAYDLTSAESAQLKDFLESLDTARAVESKREFHENLRRSNYHGYRPMYRG